MFRKKWALALLVGLLSGTGPTNVADAHTRSCGDVITANEELHNDIGPCHGDGLVVAASNITVDLNGHRIFGKGGLEVTHQAAGVRVLGQRNVTVINGTLQGFYHGIRVSQGSGNRVSRVRVLNNQGGNGIVLENSSDNVVSENVVSGNGRFSGIATFDSVSLPAGSARNTITNNVVSLNNFQGAHGISIENGAGHRIHSNQVTGSARDGVSLSPPVSDTTVSGNRVRGNNRHGINVQNGAVRNLVEGNSVTQNAQNGILVAGQNNRIRANRTEANGVFDLRDPNVGDTCGGNVWSGNTFGTASPACAQT